MNTSPRNHPHHRRHLSTAKEPLLTDQSFERIPVQPETPQAVPFDPMGQFKLDTGNESFRLSTWTWVNLIGILLIYPALSMVGDPTTMLKTLAENKVMLYAVLIGTIGIQWAIFGINYVVVYLERTFLKVVVMDRLK